MLSGDSRARHPTPANPTANQTGRVHARRTHHVDEEADQAPGLPLGAAEVRDADAGADEAERRQDEVQGLVQIVPLCVFNVSV